jgi:hypothetical protein
VQHGQRIEVHEITKQREKKKIKEERGRQPKRNNRGGKRIKYRKQEGIKGFEVTDFFRPLRNDYQR